MTKILIITKSFHYVTQDHTWYGYIAHGVMTKSCVTQDHTWYGHIAHGV